ncbi:MAG: hypothetical protein ACK5MR_11685 [Cumulibacter sp.]
MTDIRQTVITLLAQAKISPTADELDRLVGDYEETRASIDKLYAVPGVRYEEPALTFDPRQG